MTPTRPHSRSSAACSLQSRASIVDAALAVSDRNSSDINKYIARMDAQDAKIEQLTLAVQHCEAEHMKARTALANAGIAYG